MSENKENKIVVDHPDYYGGKDNPYEAAKVIAAYGFDFFVGNAFKYMARAGKKPGEPEAIALRKAIKNLELKLEYLESIDE